MANQSKYETIEEVKQMLTASDFTCALSYYGIRVVKNSILCPMHNDRHYGSCIISKNGKRAHCYACGETIDAISLVMNKESMSYIEAIKFLWETILGRTLPEHRKSDNTDFLKYNELMFIGVFHAGGGNILCVSNISEKKSLLPEPYIMDYKNFDANGYYPVGIQQAASSIYKLYESDPKTALFILRGKANETIKYYYDLKRILKNPNTKIGQAAYSDADFMSSTLEKLQKKINYAKKICRKINYLSKKAH